MLFLILSSRGTGVWTAKDWVQSFSRERDRTAGNDGMTRPLLAGRESHSGLGRVIDEEDGASDDGSRVHYAGPRMQVSAFGNGEGWGTN